MPDAFLASIVKFAVPAAVGLVLAVAGCTVDGDQCKSESDCTGVLGVSVDQLQCVRGVCSKRGTTRGTDPTASQLACRTTRDCEGDAGSGPSFCRAERCVQILQNGIDEVSPNFTQGEPVFIGVITTVHVVTPEGTLESEYDKTNTDGIRLASDDWRAATNQALTVAGARRPLTTVYCDTEGSLDKMMSCFDAMTNVLHAPVVIVRSDPEAAAILPAAIERDVVVYCTDCEPTNFRSQNTSGHLWFGFASLGVLQPMRTAWVQALEATVRKERNLAPAATVKAAVVTSLQQATIGNLSVDAIRLNGKTSAEGIAAGTIIHRVVDRGSPADFRTLARELAAFGPDIVVVENLGREFHFHLMPEIEAAWATATPRPHYVSGSDEAAAYRFERSVGGNDELRRRVSGVSFNVDDPAIDDNLNQYLRSFGALRKYDPKGISTGFESYYVASYAVVSALNLSTANAARLSGRDVIEGLNRLVTAPGSELVDVRASDIGRGVNLLTSKQRIDLRGLNSTLDWDPATGELNMNASTYCVKRTSAGFSLEELWVYSWEKQSTVRTPDLTVCAF